MSEFEIQKTIEETCRWCGGPLIQPEGLCPKCDVVTQDISNKKKDSSTPKKESSQTESVYYEAKGSFYSGGFDWLVVLLLCFFAGFIGLHRFYTGNFIIGTFQAMTLGGFGIWSFIDLILIITGSYRDGSGKPLVKNKRG